MRRRTMVDSALESWSDAWFFFGDPLVTPFGGHQWGHQRGHQWNFFGVTNEEKGGHQSFWTSKMGQNPESSIDV